MTSCPMLVSSALIAAMLVSRSGLPARSISRQDVPSARSTHGAIGTGHQHRTSGHKALDGEVEGQARIGDVVVPHHAPLKVSRQGIRDAGREPRALMEDHVLVEVTP